VGIGETLLLARWLIGEKSGEVSMEAVVVVVVVRWRKGLGTGEFKLVSARYATSHPLSSRKARVMEELIKQTHLVLMPLSQPPNALLTSPPAPLSQAMPSHSTENQHTAAPGEHESIGTKMKNLFSGNRRNSKNDDPSSTTTTGHEKIVDQTGGGEQLPSAAANAIGADNLNSNAETGFPGVINGDKLGAIVVSLASIDHANVKLRDLKKEGSFVTVPVSRSYSLHRSTSRELY
jgi:hypothetical protein